MTEKPQKEEPSETPEKEPVKNTEGLDDNSPIDIGQAFRESHVGEVLDKLDRELVGLKAVKTRIREIAAFLLIDRLRSEAGLASDQPVLHMSFTGNPGTGKTTVAMRMAEILHHLGYIRRSNVEVATRDDLVGQYIGHTAPKTKEVIKKAMGGVLFIDEAYYLYKPENERDYGQESIEILLQVMENQRGDLVVILAGYKNRMEIFFQSNPGIRSRIAHHIDFPDFSLEELMEIADLMLGEQNYHFDKASRTAFKEYLERRMTLPHFSNARSVRNAIDRMKLRQANRLFSSDKKITRRELARIDEGDVRKSRVFEENPASDGPSGEKKETAKPKEPAANLQ